MQFPLISILLAVRNEEDKVLYCLKALDTLDYPREKLQILIGNDASSDDTKNIIVDFIKDKPHFMLFNIEQINPKLKGKANVLAQLSRQAKGSFYFFTDADIEVPPTWIKAILKIYRNNKNIGIITGFTFIKGQSIFAKLQAMEWTQALSCIKALSDLKVPTTAMGNNMSVSRKAYEATGGYERIGFSVTEDFTLFEAIRQKAFGFKHLINPSVTAFSQPVSNLKVLLQQRKRWMYGALKTALYLRLLLVLQALFLPLALVLAFTLPFTSLALILGKSFLDFFLVSFTLCKVRTKHTWQYLILLPLFTFYQSMIALLSLIFYYLPIKTKWKGRVYN